MQFEAVKDILLSDTPVPDIFLSDIMPNLPPEAVKVYLYCVFLSKYGKEARVEDLSSKLGITVDSVNAALGILERGELVIRTPQVISITDLKEREITRIYRLKTSSDPSEAVSRTASNIRRNQCVDSINKMCFQGMMSSSWYTMIDHLFDLYHFDEDVMVALFKYCYDHCNLNRLNVGYVEKVGASWASKGVTNHWELEKFMEFTEKINEAGKHISKLLRLGRKLTAFEERYLETWLGEYGYSMDIIELALEKTTGKTNPNFKYINGVLEGWFKEGLKTKEQITAAAQAAPAREKKEDPGKPNRRDTFMQRSYDDSFFDMIENAALKGKVNRNGGDKPED